MSKQAVHKQLNVYLSQKDHQEQMLKLIHDIRKEHPTMGMRDLYYKIRPTGIGRDRFESFCRSHSLQSKRKKNQRRTTDSSGVIRFDNLLIDLTVDRINQVWQSDITYYEVGDRFYYLTFILDACSRRIVGHQVSKHLRTEHTTLPALKEAVKNRGGKLEAGIIFHSDGGGQYYAKDFLEYTAKLKMINSMCEFAWENGKAERINGIIKNNYLIHRRIESFDDLVGEVDRAVRLYNSEKPHKELDRKSPVTYELELVKLQQQPVPKMTASLEANSRFTGASSPRKSEQPDLRIQLY